ncbi:hypothetical protein LJR118_000291 [Acidovorax sp. LjRoot118]|uniref:DUF7210 family protein n=1 Tax=Acidovorax sp. LjRoot118 TaxID=3342256 RepID=UPI003ECDBAFC
MPKYIAKEPIKHDGKRYEPGATIELSKDEAEKLRGSDAISAERPKAEKSVSDQSAGDGGKLAEAGAQQQPPAGGLAEPQA